MPSDSIAIQLGSSLVEKKHNFLTSMWAKGLSSVDGGGNASCSIDKFISNHTNVGLNFIDDSKPSKKLEKTSLWQ